ncbi:MAG: hypothetical protein ACOC33_02060 [bacterium]
MNFWINNINSYNNKQSKGVLILGKSFKSISFNKVKNNKNTERKKNRQKERILLKNIHQIDEDTFDEFEEIEKKNSFLID